jgi:hypothetical protein
MFVFRFCFDRVIYLVTEKVLKALMKKRREKVEEIKQKTNYYSTRDLLQKYDDSSPGSPVPLRHRLPAGQPVPVTPQRTTQSQIAKIGPPPPNADPQVLTSRKAPA